MSTIEPGPGPAPAPRRGPRWLIGVGAILALIALFLVVAGAALVLVHLIARDSDGYYTSPDRTLTTRTAALTATRFGLTGIDKSTPDWLIPDDLGTVRLRVRALDGGPVFVGVAPVPRVDRLLARTAHDEVRSLDDAARYTRIPGRARAPRPASISWTASSSGSGERTVRFDALGDPWAVAVMRPSGAPGVKIRGDAGVRTGLLLPVGLGALVAGLVLGALAFLAIRRGSR